MWSRISSAIRKLARFSTQEERTRTLWRGITGELPHTFWQADQAGLLCVTDLGLMSTSTARTTPVHYMSATSANVLWEVRAGAEDDSGFHCGADVSLLSQFAGEEEVLFPPLTMLRVMPRSSSSADAAAIAATEASTGESFWEVHNEQLIDGKRFKRISVVPSFI